MMFLLKWSNRATRNILMRWILPNGKITRIRLKLRQSYYILNRGKERVKVMKLLMLMILMKLLKCMVEIVLSYLKTS